MRIPTGAALLPNETSRLLRGNIGTGYAYCEEGCQSRYGICAVTGQQLGQSCGVTQERIPCLGTVPCYKIGSCGPNLCCGKNGCVFKNSFEDRRPDFGRICGTEGDGSCDRGCQSLFGNYNPHLIQEGLNIDPSEQIEGNPLISIDNGNTPLVAENSDAGGNDLPENSNTNDNGLFIEQASNTDGSDISFEEASSYGADTMDPVS